MKRKELVTYMRARWSNAQVSDIMNQVSDGHAVSREETAEGLWGPS